MRILPLEETSFASTMYSLEVFKASLNLSVAMVFASVQSDRFYGNFDVRVRFLKDSEIRCVLGPGLIHRHTEIDLYLFVLLE